MDYQKNAHGTYEFDLSYISEGIIIGRGFGSWNLEAATQWFNKQCDIHKEHLEGSRWGMLSDARKWELCTPDVTEYFDWTVQELVKIGLYREAFLPSTNIQKAIVSHYGEKVKESQRKIEYFTCESAALEWLRLELKPIR
ncbi:hypothetical protein [Dongshaea marina]|uniref:hypothetical protein n=1 Tax=Dongshaea marina TaxID=2047966 RepID=UPI000D3E4CD8|nr:hypothetical protein [Dongshaea marina]